MKKKYPHKALVIGILLVLVAGASALVLFPYEPKQPPQADDSESSKEGIQDVINSNNNFALDLYNQVEQQGNIFFSPYSIFSALAMTYEGARANTKEEMASVFHYPGYDLLRPNFASLYNDINKNHEYELRTGNALWAQYDYEFLEEYMNNVERYYGGKAVNLDFRESEEARNTINSFIEEQTNNKIKDLIPKGMLDSLTKLVLTNAIYFKGTWEWEFKKSRTEERDFHTPAGTVQVPMMRMKPEEAKFNYADLEKLQVLELPYKGEDISMLILLPKQGERYDSHSRETISYDYTLDDIELDMSSLEEYKASMKETKMDTISMPRFEFETKYLMKDTLISLGMPIAFGSNADFSGMDGKGKLFIDQVIHQAYVKVDEKGTEAAAATAVAMKELAAMPSNIFIADHPFIFIIQKGDIILFMGKVDDPSK